MSAESDTELDRSDMAQLAAGLDVSLNSLMERHGMKLLHYLIRVLQDETEASDLAQETFVRVYQHRSRFNPSQKFSSWLYAIATNLARDRLRWRARHPQVSLDAEREDTGGSMADTLKSPSLSPAETAQAEERAVAVRNAVAALPEELRLPLVLAEYEGRSHGEIAAILDCSIKAVEMRVYRARQELRARLSQWLEQV
ncbi:MAG: sigma-70 family RNA polymerase sigma factor [Chloroflexi bacterium]|nr:sigma-70 family RNA polymerase sigma factor [Chloroflexota bacterium]